MSENFGPDDTEVEIDTAKAKSAYDAFEVPEWLAERYRRKKIPVHKDRALKENISLLLQQRRIDFSRNETLFASRKTISSWKGGTSSRLYRRRSVVYAIFQITGVDISKESILSASPVDFTKLVELGTSTIRRVSNTPDEDGREMYALGLSSLVFQSASHPVKSTWIEDTGVPVDIGRVYYAVDEARLCLDGNVAEILEPIRYLPSGEAPDRGSADGCVITWREGRKGWLIQSDRLGELRSTVSNVALGHIVGKPGDTIGISVKLEGHQVVCKFDLGDRKDESKAKETLMALILGQRPDRPATASFQQLVLT